jgi:poly-gamma-glutamate capsule biosynthesis protein CapA/YwtB (metallophosphatase superfamily)
MTTLIENLETGVIRLREPKGEGLDILFTGDIYFGNGTHEICLRGEYETLFNDTRSVLEQADISVTNVECPLTARRGPIRKVGPNLIADPACAGALRYAGFAAAALANNHILDQGEAGLLDTIEALQNAGVATVGAGRNLADAQKPLVLIKKSVKVGFLNVTEHEFSIATRSAAGACPMDPVANYAQIQAAKKETDVLFVIVHGGNEHNPLPNPWLVQTCRFYADLGVTAVIGHHPHCPTGFEIRNGVPIFYSLGNFIFDAGSPQEPSWHEGFLVTVVLRQNLVSELRLIPYQQWKNGPGARLLSGEERAKFFETIGEASSVIMDQGALVGGGVGFCRSRKAYYVSTLLRLGRVRSALLAKGVSPRILVNQEEVRMLLNLIRCESHRELSIEVLERFLTEGDT